MPKLLLVDFVLFTKTHCFLDEKFFPTYWEKDSHFHTFIKILNSNEKAVAQSFNC